MGRRTAAVGAAVAVAISAAAAWVPSRPATAQTPRPNIVVIMTDDQDRNSIRFMSKVHSSLTEHGTRFLNSFNGYSLCCPSRATYLTGQYAHNHGVMANVLPEGGYGRLDHANTLPVWLQAAGYRTAHIGKYLNGYGRESAATAIPPGYDNWQGLVDNTTYRMYEYTINDNGTLETYGTDPADYQTDVLAARAEQVVKAWAPAAEPFFLTVAPLAPHSEGRSPSYAGGKPRPAPRHVGKLAGEPLPRPASFNEPDVSDKPAYIRDLPPMSQATIDAVTNSYRARGESLLAVDEMVERLVTALAQAGELDNTIIVFTSDNGFFHGEHRIPNGKFHVYEPSIQVPLVVRGPGFPVARVGSPVSNVDLVATFVQAAEAKPGRTLDGIALQQTLKGGEADQRTVLNENGPSSVLTSGWQRAVRGLGFVYSERSSGEREYYDLVADPEQLVNRASDPALARRIAELSTRLADLARCAGASCHGLPSSPPPGVAAAPTPAPATSGSRRRTDVTLPHRRIGRSGSRRLTVVVACADGTEAGCYGTLSLTILARSRSGRSIRIPAGKAKLELSQGTTKRVRVTLRSSARRYLARHRRVRLRATAKIEDNGGLRQTVRRTYRLTVKKRRTGAT